MLIDANSFPDSPATHIHRSMLYEVADNYMIVTIHGWLRLCELMVKLYTT